MNNFKAQIDIVEAVQDYAPNASCLRLIGVSGADFDAELFNTPSGCATYVIDLGWHDLQGFIESIWDCVPNPLTHRGAIDSLEQEPPDAWLEIDFTPSHGPSNSYYYEAFAPSEPTYMNVASVRRLHTSAVVAPPPAGTVPSLPTGSIARWTLTAFHVGQGMCSLLAETGGTTGVLLDVGAGTPVRRGAYRTGYHAIGTTLVNELDPRFTPLTLLPAFVSHPDSDHWRLLDWDLKLLAAVSAIYLPSAVPSLAFSSTHVKPKVYGIGSTLLWLTKSDSLDLRRSKPRFSDRNGQCLVAVVDCNGEKALLSGDYVYDRMKKDGVAAICSAATANHDAIVVPHHGDAASAVGVPVPSVSGTSKAFFSAGTHAGYGHPTASSISAHSSAGFHVIDRHTVADILACVLIP